MSRAVATILMPLAALKQEKSPTNKTNHQVATTLMPLAALKPRFWHPRCIFLNAEVSPGKGCREIPAPLTQGSIIMYENRHPSIAVFWYT